VKQWVKEPDFPPAVNTKIDQLQTHEELETESKRDIAAHEQNYAVSKLGR
jgi:hypothetical protein